jgi:excisionase family DNA binding protein
MDSTPVDAATVAAKLGQAKSSVYRLAQAGLIPSYAAGSRLRGRRFDLAEVKEALRRLAHRQIDTDNKTV